LMSRNSVKYVNSLITSGTRLSWPCVDVITKP
jgi:hypothetical protein